MELYFDDVSILARASVHIDVSIGVSRPSAMCSASCVPVCYCVPRQGTVASYCVTIFWRLLTPVVALVLSLSILLRASLFYVDALL